MAKRKRRIRSPHPGVVLKQRVLPSGKTAWRARFTDPDLGREVYVTLDPEALKTHDARTLWAKQKAQSLAKRRMDLQAGAPSKTHTPVKDATKSFLEDAGNRLRASTLSTYKHQGIEQFGRWAEARGIAHVESLTPPLLAELRAAIVAGGKHATQKGGRRGARKSTAAKRAAITTNTHLKSTKVLLNNFRARGLLPNLSKDTIADALKPLPLPHEQPEYLASAQLGKLLRAAMRHDADVYTLTRAEKDSGSTVGNTRRYDPIAPFVAFVLLTGCRRGEAVGLRWADVDLDAVDAQGHVVGEIRLRAEHTKTHHARTIGLEVSPMLRALLAAMKLRARKGAAYVFEVPASRVRTPDPEKRKRGPQPYSVDLVESTRQRLMSEYGAPGFDWQMLRSTCATFLTNAPGIFGAATVFMSARQLGHSVAVAERHYLGVHRGIPKDAHTLEAAMQIAETVREVIDAATSAPALSSVQAQI